MFTVRIAGEHQPLDVEPLYRLRSTIAIKLMFELLRRTGTDRSVVLLPDDRKAIAAKLSLYPQQITTALFELREAGLLTGSKNEFTIHQNILP